MTATVTMYRYYWVNHTMFSDRQDAQDYLDYLQAHSPCGVSNGNMRLLIGMTEKESDVRTEQLPHVQAWLDNDRKKFTGND